MDAKAFEALMEQNFEDQQSRYQQYLDDIRQDAIGWLESRGLPTTRWVVAEDGRQQWKLHTYICDFCKKSSNADVMAGLIVEISEGLDEVDHRIRESQIIKLMQAQTKFLLFHDRGKVNAENARLDRSKPWAKELAAELVEQFDKFPDAWRSLRRRARENSILGEYAGYEIELELDSDTLKADDKKILTKESFRTGEFRNAKTRKL